MMKRRELLKGSLATGAVAIGGYLHSIRAGSTLPKCPEWKFEPVAGPFSFTEGPVWDGEAVLFTDIPNNRIMRYDPRDGSCREHRTGTMGANGLALDRNGRLYACQGGLEGRKVVCFEAAGSVTVLADRFEGKRLNSPNDLSIDRLGRIWFSDPRYGDRSGMDLTHESVYRLEEVGRGHWSIQRMTFDTTRPNGLLVTPDLKILYVAQSDHGEDQKKELRAYPILEDGTLGDCRILHNFSPHRGVDGMTFDSEFNVIAAAGSDTGGPGPMIYVFSPSGRVLETHPVPSPPTNCAFGDRDLQSLYVTAYDGSLYRARTHRRGSDSVLQPQGKNTAGSYNRFRPPHPAVLR